MKVLALFRDDQGSKKFYFPDFTSLVSEFKRNSLGVWSMEYIHTTIDACWHCIEVEVIPSAAPDPSPEGHTGSLRCNRVLTCQL